MDELIGLPLEYQRDYGTATGNLNVFDLVNDPAANGVCRVLRLLLAKEVGNLFLSEIGVLSDDRTYPVLIAEESIQLFSEVLFLKSFALPGVEPNTVKHEG